MAMSELDQAKLAVLASAGPYPMEAYGFVHAGLGYTVRRVHGRTEGVASPGEAGGRSAGQPTGQSSSQSGTQPASSDGKAGRSPTEDVPNEPSESTPQWSSRFPLDLDQGSSGRRHVNGQQLCLGLREYAVDRFGLFAPAVFGQWHIHRTDDFGRMVFAMIKAQIMSRTAQDSIDDFRGVYDFDEAFSRDALLRGIGVRAPRAGTAPEATAGTAPGASTDALRDGAARHDC